MIQEIPIQSLDPEKFIDEKVQEIADTVGQGKAINALSGGVDSSVVTALGHRALKERLITVFIENGLMREGEPGHVQRRFQDMGIKVEIVDAKAFDHSWGEIGQAYRLADETTTAADILAMGVQEFRQAEREAARSEREAEREAREEERDQKTAARIAEQYGIDVAELDPLYEQCEGSWGCVRKALKDQTSTAGSSDREARTAAQIASKYGVSQAEVMQTFENACGYDWNCVRAHYRELAKEGRGKPDK